MRAATATQPTLFSSIDKAYAINTGLVPPLNQTTLPTALAIPTYTPCGAMDHRPFIDGTGDYPGRGIVTQFDGVAFQRNDATSFAAARVEALAGLGVPYHYRSNRTRTRSGESADTANTPIVLKMAPKATSYYDFTAQGMPIAVDAYNGGNTPTNAQDGYVAPVGGTGVWGVSGDPSHAADYCGHMALMTGDEWLLEALIDLSLNLGHQSIYGFHENIPVWSAEYNSSTPTDVWTGLLGQFLTDNVRSLGWAQLIQSHAASLIPSDHVAFGYLQALLGHNGDYIGSVLDHLPADFAAAGAYYPENQNEPYGQMSPWFIGFISFCANDAYLRVEDTRWKRLGALTATRALALAAAGRYYMFDTYRIFDRRSKAAWNASTNPLTPAVQQPFLCLDSGHDTDPPSFTVDATGLFTLTAIDWNSLNQEPPPFTAGDKLIFTTAGNDGSLRSLPPGFIEGQVCYIRDLTNPQKVHSGATVPQFRVSATIGGAAVVPSAAGVANAAWLPQSASNYSTIGTSQLYDFPYLLNWSNYIAIMNAVIMLARQAGDPNCTPSIITGLTNFLAPAGAATYPPFDMMATV